jgi:FkbM family methyltransferase
VAYLCWRVLRLPFRLEVRLKTGTRILLRPLPAEDYGAARGVFVVRDYDDPRKSARPVRRIVDLGANIGCSCLFWFREYPECRVEAFEPHATHLEMLRENLRRNGLENRVLVHPAAAGVRQGSIFLSDQGMSSRVSPEERSGDQRVPVMDFFDAVGDRPIDLLKIDIEGSEYVLLADARFPMLQVHTLVLEWHPTTEYPGDSGGMWCRQRLAAAGYNVEEHKALLWGWRE